MQQPRPRARHRRGHRQPNYKSPPRSCSFQISPPMKCHSVAALWSPSLPSHHITAGALSVAPPRAIVVMVFGDGDAASVVLADAQGRAQVVPLAEGVAIGRGSPRPLSMSSVSSGSSLASAEATDGRVEAAVLSDDGKVVALVLKTSCLLKCVVEGAVLGEVSLASTSLCKEEEAGVKGCLSRGVFLSGREWGARVSEDGIVVRTLVLWSSNGGAMVYRVVVGTASFWCEAVSEIPGICI